MVMGDKQQHAQSEETVIPPGRCGCCVACVHAVKSKKQSLVVLAQLYK